ncbi:cation-translocating P-type ATPase [Marinilabilia salmonicolor]|jgi:Cu2+-exporting ATPase|uniref:Cu2+-exporting ATPase n=1 Tax=Marinilabilia salmonicolor TaxID=989 RepID=A0A2T0XMV8_9BACT|nr:heavy metal translocating P-type ATPase [Marinilabilia salmonicolor]PRZ00288.1 Cu2+-exporting ATPase [Marinilabilia salmonicolor]RCW38404.1 Cu2+-exporting ATPase [Marinilabilia salmonicolor]
MSDKNKQWILPITTSSSDVQESNIAKAFKEITTIEEWNWEPNNQRIVLQSVDEKAPKTAVEQLENFGVDVLIHEKSIPVEGMSCAACSSSVESMLNAQQGILEANVNLAQNTVKVKWIPENIGLSQMKKVIQSIGYDLIIDEKESTEEALEESRRKKSAQTLKRLLWAGILAFPVFMIGMFFMNIPYANYIMWALTTPVLFIFGRHFFVNAFKQARHGAANMDTLVALSTGMAYLFSSFNTLFPEVWSSQGLEAHVYFEAAAVIIVFIMLGKWLEERAKEGTSSAIRKLMGLQPRKVIKQMEDGSWQETDIHLVEKGDILRVKPGNKIPVDGEVTDGTSFVDESTVTGESMPVEKKNGAKVYTGTINQAGSFNLKAEKVGGDTVLAQIIKTVQDAQATKAPVQRMVDKVASVFVPAVMATALLTFVVWMLFGGTEYLTQALLATVSVLVIACPCALGLATPTAIMVGVGKGANKGILIKDATSLEKAHKANAVVLDKTGTITIGKPEITNMQMIDSKASKSKVHGMIHAVESHSEHPLAGAVVKFIEQEGDFVKFEAENFQNHSGNGVSADIDGEKVFIGNEGLIRQNKIEIPSEISDQIKAWQSEAKTVILVTLDGKITALLAIADKIKESSREAILRLQKQNIEVHMLTGDNQETAAAVAKATGIKNFKAQVMPNEKAAFVKELQQKGKIVAMVGDGINDSEALALADLSIAMGKGADVAMDVAAMTITSSDLMKIPEAMKLSDKTVKTIRQNLFWAFFYNVIAIPVAAGVLFPVSGFLLNPMIAGAAMAFSSVSVVSNSLRLKRARID